MAEKKKVSFVFEGGERAPVVPVTGVWGGPSPEGGLLAAHLYTSIGSLPNVISSPINEGGQVNINEGDKVFHGDITNKIQVSIVMTPDHAINIANWMIQKAQEMKGGKLDDK